MSLAKKKGYVQKKKDPHLKLVAQDGVEATSKYEAIFNQASDAIISLNGELFDDANMAFQQLTGFIKADLMGKSIACVAPQKGHDKIPMRTRPLAMKMFAQAGTYEDVAVLRKDGHIRIVDMSVRHVNDPKSGALAIVLLRDVTERKKMERELVTKHGELQNAYHQMEKANLDLKAMQEILVQSGKLAALGELAAGIAHEINQPLQGIRGYSQELQAIFLPKIEGSDKETAEYFLNEVITNTDKMAKIIKHLRTFTSKSEEGFESIDVHTSVDNCLKLVHNQFKSHGIEVKKDFGDLPAIYTNEVQLEQVFINLLTNARDAIEATGRGQGQISIKTVLDGDFIEATVEDNGIGMDTKTKKKLFNPFFTTKEVGKGMGIGLSLSYGILEKLQGTIVVESSEGKGTKFLIRLPKDYRELP